MPPFNRSEYGSEFVAETVKNGIKTIRAKTAYIKAGSPFKNRFCKRFNARLSDIQLDSEGRSRHFGCGSSRVRMGSQDGIVGFWKKFFIRAANLHPQLSLPLDERPVALKLL